MSAPKMQWVRVKSDLAINGDERKKCRDYSLHHAIIASLPCKS